MEPPPKPYGASAIATGNSRARRSPAPMPNASLQLSAVVFFTTFFGIGFVRRIWVCEHRISFGIYDFHPAGPLSPWRLDPFGILEGPDEELVRRWKGGVGFDRFPETGFVLINRVSNPRFRRFQRSGQWPITKDPLSVLQAIPRASKLGQVGWFNIALQRFIEHTLLNLKDLSQSITLSRPYSYSMVNRRLMV